ncbi:MAG TPA: hypothetical protein PKE40_03710 [Arachnia sp.]|nr:hypothetical protein [Arachnia sp.]
MRSFVVAPRGCEGLFGILGDWSALGLIDEFLWFYADTVASDRMTAIAVSEGRLRVEQLATSLPPEGGTVRILALSPTDRPEDLAPATDVAVAVNAAGTYHLRRVRCVFPVGALSSWPIDTEPGWSSYVLSPEVPLGPREASEPVEFGSRQAELQAAANLVSLLGLWTAMPASPIDERSEGDTLRLVRSALRGWDGAAADEKLKAKTLSLPAKNPTQTRDGSPLRKSDATETPALIHGMADGLWARHRGLFLHAGETPKGNVEWGMWDVLREFFAFLAQGIWNPAQWVKAKTAAVKSTLAARVGGVLLGEESGYDVVWKADPSVPSGDVGQTAAGIGAALSSQLGLPGLPARPSFSQFWRDFTAGGLTLVDGAHRAPQAVGMIGEDPAVVGSLDAVVPKNADVFAVDDAGIDIPRHLRRIEKHDVLAQRQLAVYLNRLARQEQGTPANLAAQSLERWSTAAATSSYASLVGHRISDAYDNCLRHVGELSEEFRLTRRAAEEAALGSQSRKAGRWIRWVLVIAVILIAALVSLAIATVLPLVLAWLLVAGVVVGALTAALVGFVRNQRDLFRLLRRRRDLSSREQQLLQQLRLALQDLERCAQGYRQFLCWAQAMREIVHHPFGRVRENTHPEGGLEGLPRSIQLGAKHQGPEAVEKLSAYLRRQVLQVGWLTAPWKQLLENAHALVGHEAYELRENPGRIFEEGAGEGSSLVTWVDRLRHDDLRDADAVWADLRDEFLPGALRDGDYPYTIALPGGETLSQAGLDEFADRSMRGTRFNDRILTSEGRLRAAAEPDTVWVKEDASVTRRAVLRVEFSRGLHAGHLTHRGVPQPDVDIPPWEPAHVPPEQTDRTESRQDALDW